MPNPVLGVPPAKGDISRENSHCSRKLVTPGPERWLMVAGWKHTFKLRIDLDQSRKNHEKNRLPPAKLLGPVGTVGIRASDGVDAGGGGSRHNLVPALAKELHELLPDEPAATDHYDPHVASP